MEPREPKSFSSSAGAPVLAALTLAGILTLAGWVFSVVAVYATASGSPSVAVIVFILAIVLWVFAPNWYAFYATFSAQLRFHALEAQRAESLRRVGELRRYANFAS